MALCTYDDLSSFYTTLDVPVPNLPHWKLENRLPALMPEWQKVHLQKRGSKFLRLALLDPRQAMDCLLRPEGPSFFF